MIQLLVEYPLLLLFIVSAIGYALGRLKIKGSNLGVAAVLFVGLAVGALDPRLALPEIVFELGLITFVYTIGLSSGAGFFASFRRKGLRDNLFVLAMLLFAAAVAAALHLLFQFKPTVTAGLYAGSLTNTPALAGLLDAIGSFAAPQAREALLAEPVVGYSVAYPMGVLGVILAVVITRRLWRVDYAAEVHALRHYHLAEQNLYNRTVCVTRPEVVGSSLRDLQHHHNWPVVFSRLKRGDDLRLVTGDTILQRDDLLIVIGAPGDVDAVLPQLGEPADERLVHDRSEYDHRRVFLSNPDIAGRRLGDLRLPQKHGAIVTRIRRGDIDLLAHADMMLELGDRLRVVARRENMPGISRLFGDSYRALSELNLLTFGIGLTLGLLVGLIPIPLPGGVTFRLGFAGGPLIVALVLGAIGRSGPLVWNLPYSANLTLRQMGLILLLAGIGVRSGHTFFTTFTDSGGAFLFISGAVITCTTALLTLTIGYKLLQIPFGLLVGMLAALHTQPAVLGFSLEQSGNELPNIGYALIFPIATIAKILIAQLLLTLLS